MSKKNNILDSLNRLKEKDIYSMLLYAIYKLKDDEKYSTLSYLTWALDTNNLLNFLTIFEGATITVPSIDDLKTIIAALRMYQMTHIENREFDDAVEEINTKEINLDNLKEAYFKICDLMVNDTSGVLHVQREITEN